MANIKITDLTAYTDPASTDVLPIVDIGADATKKVSIADLLENAGSGTEALPGIAFDGDSNTGIYHPDADQLAFSTNGQGRLFVDSSGNVLLGKASEDLAIAGFQHRGDAIGLVQITRDGNTPLMLNRLTNDGKLIEFRKNTTLIGAISIQGSDLGIEVNGSECARIDSDGKFIVKGVGTEAFSVDGGAPNNSLIVDSSGRCLVGTSSQSGGSLLQVNDDRIRIASSKTPASASDTGTAGEICWDSSYIYVCTATDTWKRAALSTW